LQTLTRPPQTPAPEPIRGVVRLTAQQLRFQRRLTLLFTIAPLGGVALAIWSLWGAGISGLDFGLLVGFYVFTVIGISVGFHRLFTHRSFHAVKPVRVILATLGSMSVQGAVIDWCATHRRHHAFADEYGDPHSPHLATAAGVKGVLAGLWHAHVGWLLASEKSDVNEWTPDLVADRAIARVNRLFPWLTLATFLLPPIIGLAVTGTLWGMFTAFVWGSLVRIFLLHHMTWSINSICHFYGKEQYRARDESKNVWPMALISFGESWHNNHHAFPWSARLGLRGWQIDLGWWTIRFMKAVHLISRVKVPTREQMAAKLLRRKNTDTATRA
jgi:stearoyl-CoA desaturase (delta-9 desaturase)